MAHTDKVFAGSIPAIYDRYLAPLIFEPYAADLGERLSDLHDGQILETAAGTGVVTRALVPRLDDGMLIMATDAAADEIARRFGIGPIDGKMQAHIVSAGR